MEDLGLIFILIWINSAPSGALDQFVVTGPLHPIAAAVGSDVVLDCQLVTVGNSNVLDNMELHWINVALSYTSPVHAYKGGADDLSQQAPAYKGRTHLFSQQISQGNLSLKLTDVRVSDNGQYKCLVVSKPVQYEIKMTLNVVGRGNQPWIEMADYVSNGIRLACLSERWFPRPVIQWMNGNGDNVTDRATTTYQVDSQGLYAVRSAIAVSSEGSVSVYFCWISTEGLGEPGPQVRIQIADHFFPRMSGWLVAFLILLCLTLVAAGFALWYLRRLLGDIGALKKSTGFIENNGLRETIDKQQRSAEQEAKRVRDEREKAKQERKSELLKLRQEFEKEKIAIQAEHERREKSFADEMETAIAKYKKLETEFEQWRPLAKSEWDRIQSHAVVVHLDPQTASGSLEVSPMRVGGRKGQPLTVPDVPERFDSVPYMLGLEGFETGAHFWEVEVSSKAYWDIGVASGSVVRKEPQTMRRAKKKSLLPRRLPPKSLPVRISVPMWNLPLRSPLVKPALRLRRLPVTHMPGNPLVPSTSLQGKSLRLKAERRQSLSKGEKRLRGRTWPGQAARRVTARCLPRNSSLPKRRAMARNIKQEPSVPARRSPASINLLFAS